MKRVSPLISIWSKICTFKKSDRKIYGAYGNFFAW